MGIQVKRNTGVMGGATKVSLSVGGEKVKKLSNNEEYRIDANQGPVKIKANQMYFGSAEIEVEDQSVVEIKINQTALLLFVLSMVFLLVGVMVSPLVIGIGVVGTLVTMIYATKLV
ncbi:hypothetical protein [Oceanobacillus sp. FSL H7-0719]|uniref:hypothetical protein n=1 Tax=Oceanobacillus sp. FSL H7-0719 TaxID=2954507 RepID=UPI0032553E6E